MTSHVLPIASARETGQIVMSALARRKMLLGTTFLLLLAGSSAALVIPRALGSAVDAVIGEAGTVHLAWIGIAIVGSGLAAAWLSWWGGRRLLTLVQSIVAQLREDAFAAAMTLDISDVERAGSSDVVSRVTRDVESVTEAASGILPQLTQAAFAIVLTLAGLAVLDPWLAAAALIAAPLQAWTAFWFVRRSRPIYMSLRQQETDRGQAIIETVVGAQTVRGHLQQEDRLHLISRRSLEAVETQRQAARVRNSFYAGLNGAEFLGLAAVLAVGFWRAEAGVLSAGAVTAGALYFHQLFGPVGALLGSIDDLQRASVGLERLVGVIKAGRSDKQSHLTAGTGISIRGVRFGYQPGRDVLHGVDLDIPAGSTAVFVGASGSGKSTLARLIAGVLTGSQGEILVGGAPAADAVVNGRPAALLVSQEVHLFRGSVGDNVRLGCPDATDAQIVGALRDVGAGWVNGLPEGLESELEHTVDPGRLQQLALARALLARPSVLILDEATADAGPATRAALEQAVSVVAEGRTTVIVAHHLSQTVAADLVVVFAKGRVCEVGTHTELVARSGGEFARLWQAWSSVPHPHR